MYLCFFCFATSSCNRSEQARPAAEPAFYHWQTRLRLTAAKRNYLDSLGVKKLYVKFFDVDWDEAAAQPVPQAYVEIDTAKLDGLDLVPTVFITNRCLLNLPMLAVDSLAGRIFEKIKSLETLPPQEIQFDCDWTAKTQAKYFALLNAFKSLSSRPPPPVHPNGAGRPPMITATIRLHQLNFFEKTGVPPVDRGMLMCYNLGDLDDWATENSILDLEAAKTYLTSQSEIQYPLPLDFALPLFRWGVLFREDRMIKLLNGLCTADLQDGRRFQKIADNRYEVKKSTYLQAHYLYAGDRLRLEGVSPVALLQMAALLGQKRNGEKTTVAFYHLDSMAIQIFPKEKILGVLGRF